MLSIWVLQEQNRETISLGKNLLWLKRVKNLCIDVEKLNKILNSEMRPETKEVLDT